jgi:acyl carrier protein
VTQQPARPQRAHDIQQWLVSWIAKELSVPDSEVDVDQPFVDFGMSSRQAVLLSGDLGDWLEQEIEPSLAWDYPTIRLVADHFGS